MRHRVQACAYGLRSLRWYGRSEEEEPWYKRTAWEEGSFVDVLSHSGQLSASLCNLRIGRMTPRTQRSVQQQMKAEAHLWEFSCIDSLTIHRWAGRVHYLRWLNSSNSAPRRLRIQDFAPTAAEAPRAWRSKTRACRRLAILQAFEGEDEG